ncbi:MAG: hypothetical protein M3O22_05025, partial [Pseudomonadota bacterium]|nr:hypothetical protein [Pseudomonadota bacterium]
DRSGRSPVEHGQGHDEGRCAVTSLERDEYRMQQMINERRRRRYMEPPMWAVLLPFFLLAFVILVTT